MKLRLGLAGLGVHGLRYARHLLEGDVAGARLAAVSRANQSEGRAFARAHDVAFVSDPRDLATHAGVDVVVVVLPPDLHPEVAGACVRAGRPVLVEKPLAADLEAALDLASEVERAGALLMVAQTLRFDAVVQALRRELPVVGQLRTVAINQRFEPAERPWLDRPGPGGIVLNTGIHGFDLLRYLTGLEPVSVMAHCHAAITQRTPDEFAAIVRLEPGSVTGLVDNSRTTLSRSGRIELVGGSGQLWGDHVHRTLERVRAREIVDLGPVEPRATIPAVLAAFVASVNDGTPPPVTVADGASALAMVEAATRSALEGRTVALTELL